MYWFFTSIGMNIVEHVIKLVKLVSESPVSFDILIKSIHVQPIKIVRPLILSNNIHQRCFSNVKHEKWRLTRCFFKSKFKTFALRDGLSLRKSN